MIIAQISDSHIDPESEMLENRLSNLRREVDDINSLDSQPDIVIHTGDVAHNGTQEKYDLALEILGDLKAPLHVCPGNRDDRALIVKNFRTGRNLAPGSKYLQYSIDDYPLRLISLDTLHGSVNMGDYCLERAEALASALAEEPEKPTALFMHHPPFEVVESKYRFQFDDWNTVDYLAGAVRGQAQVKRIFCGHAHRNAMGDFEGIPVGSVPSIAVDLRLGDFPAEAVDTPVYFLHNYDGNAFDSELRVCRG
jgi:Icc protein